MSERTPITNLLLLTVLTTILLVSGSLQCAFDCLTRVDDPYRPALRVDNCHLVLHVPAPAPNCPNKACHQGNSYHQDLDQPAYQRQAQQSHPLVNPSPSPVPQVRSGDSPLLLLQETPKIVLAKAAYNLPPVQSLREIRSTVLLN